MKVRKGQSLEVDISDIAFGGRGITRINGLVVFVENAIPGDRLRIKIIKKFH